MRLLNPVAPAENHPNCRRDEEGRAVLPGGQPWQQQLLMLCLSSKARARARSITPRPAPACAHACAAMAAPRPARAPGSAGALCVLARRAGPLQAHAGPGPPANGAWPHSDWAPPRQVLADADALLKIPAGNAAARGMAQMFRMGQRLPPIPHLLSVMVQPKAPRQFPDEEADIKRDDQIARLASEDERRKEARPRRPAQGLTAMPAAARPDRPGAPDTPTGCPARGTLCPSLPAGLASRYPLQSARGHGAYPRLTAAARPDPQAPRVPQGQAGGGQAGGRGGAQPCAGAPAGPLRPRPLQTLLGSRPGALSMRPACDRAEAPRLRAPSARHVTRARPT